MTHRVFENENSFEVSDANGTFDIYVFSDVNDREMIISVENLGGIFGGERANYTITAEEATRLKEFLIKRGY